MADRGAAPAAPGPTPRRALLAVLVAWLLPGAGHVMLGRHARGAAFLTIILICLVLGVKLEGNLYRVLPDRPLSVLATAASMGVGAPYFLLRFGAGYEGTIRSPGYEYGTAFILTAGLMNLLLVLDVWDIARGRKE